MAKTATVTATKTATKTAKAKTVRDKSNKAEKEAKPKRAPSAYNLFVKAHMKPWLDANKGKSVKDGMAHIGGLWKDAPENPNRGKTMPARKPKATKTEKENAAEKQADVAAVESSEEEVGSED